MIKRFALAVAVVGATFGIAHAGLREGFPTVNVWTSSRAAQGQMGDARASADGQQYITCTVESWNGTLYTSCGASTANGTTGSCWTSNASFASAAAAITSDSMIYFGWDANGYCTVLEVTAGSHLGPKQP